MNDVPARPDSASTKAQGDLDRLNGQVAVMRAVLVQLLQDVVRADSRLDQGQAAQLLGANEQLVVSALGAQSDAETANGALDEASRVGGLDPLTGLPNRTQLLNRFETAILNARRRGNRVALLFLDLNGFKQVNDTFGHAAGDRALQLVADCLRSLVRESDMVSRHGGDEFLVLLSEVTHAADAALVAEKVNTALAAYSRIDNPLISLTASIGISIYPDDGRDTTVLIDRADAAMYLAKSQALGGFVFHDSDGKVHAGLSTPAAGPKRLHLAPHESVVTEQDRRHQQLREANEKLVLAALGAQELLAAAEEARRRQSQLLAIVAEELGNPLAPIRLAASTLGIPGAEATLLPRVQAAIEEQTDRMLRMVSQALEQRGPTGS
ncbi:MAG: diguanylate cyclase [Burkholderiales bacterium]